MNRTIVLDLNRIFKTCISAVLPECLVKNSLKYNSSTKILSIVNKEYDLSNQNLYVVGMGKAVQSMAYEIENILSTEITGGVISVPVGSYNYNMIKKHISYYEGAENNLPDVNALNTANKVKELICELSEKDILMVLISGGGSALLPLPKSPITLDEKTNLIKKLANCGADIRELNIVRKRISDLKGGQLVIQAYPAKVISLILSDIVGDPLDLIASGPTYENCDNKLDALNIIHKYKLYDDLPNTIKHVLNCDDDYSFPKKNVQNVIIGSNKLAIEAAITEAKMLNYFPIFISNIVEGNVKSVAKEYTKLVQIVVKLKENEITIADFTKDITSLNIPGIKSIKFDINMLDTLTTKEICIIFGGETTVEVKGMGKGGRNQQLALEFSYIINKLKYPYSKYDIYFLSAGTDGIDGPTDAAGAIGYNKLVIESKKVNIDITEYLKNNDSYNFYKKFMNGDLHIITGHTNTNVMDIHLIIIKKISTDNY